MEYDITFSPEAVKDWRELKANLRAQVRDAIEQQLRHQPTRTSKSRLKRLHGLLRPQYRLRVGDVRVFYDVSDDRVEILGIVIKDDAEAWLGEFGELDENGSSE
jgi:mRNA interferase RelE/StbE